MSTPAPPAPVLADDADLVAQLCSFLVRRVDDLAPTSGRSARTSVRQRVAALHRRRRRLRHALGSSTLAAGVTAGGVQHWLVGDQSGQAPATTADASAGPPATEPPPTAPPTTEPPIAPPPPPAPVTS